MEIVNLLTIGMTSFNIRQQVPNDISEDNQYVPPENLKSQDNLNKINSWTNAHQIMINQTKTKTLISNHTNKSKAEN